MKPKKAKKLRAPVQVLVTLQHPDNAKADWVTYVRLALVGMMIPVIKVEKWKPRKQARKAANRKERDV